MNQDRYANLVTNIDPAKVEINVHTTPEGWSQVLHVFTREHMRRLSIAPTRIMLHMFDRRDRRSGRSMTDRRTIATECELSPAAISEGLRALTTFQPILLAVHSPTEYEVYPGRIFAGAYARDQAQAVRGREDRLRRGEESVRRGERDFAAANEPCVLHREARARQNTHSRTRDENSNQKAEPEAPAGLVSEWPEPDLFGKQAIERRDVRGLLLSLKVWHYAAEALALSPDISVELVMHTAREVAADRGARNPPRYLAGRLARILGVNLPDCPGSKRLTAEQLAGPLGGIERMRRDRVKLFSLDEGPWGMSSVDYARSEDE